jgi:hypothetical protein
MIKTIITLMRYLSLNRDIIYSVSVNISNEFIFKKQLYNQTNVRTIIKDRKIVNEFIF